MALTFVLSPHGEIVTPAFEIAEEICSAPFGIRVREKQYATAAIGCVLSGWIDYHSPSGSASLVPGAVILANAGESFSCRHHNTLGNRRLVTRFSAGFLEQVARDCGHDDACFPLATLPPGRPAAQLLGRMRRLACEGRNLDETAYLLAAAALHVEGADGAPARVPIRDRQRITTVLRYIERDPAGDCSLATLAGLAALSRYHFIRLFKAMTGRSPNQYVIHMRLCAAADRLLATKSPVAQVAFDVGFNDISHFNARFRAMFGCSPRQWRSGC